MGGSGSGKSSLLNALCGRAGYGKVTGDIKINGNNTTIDEHKNVIGFVPQDDIVYPDLSVRENLVSRRMFLSHSVGVLPAITYWGDVVICRSIIPPSWDK